MKRMATWTMMALLSGVMASMGSAEIVLTSDFDGHTSVDGATEFTGINWTVNGLSMPSSTIDYFEGGFVEMSGAAENADRLAVQPDLSEEYWFFFVLITPEADVTIDFITFDYQLLNADGTHATEARPFAAVLNGGIHDFSTGGVGPLIGNSGFGLEPVGSDDPATNSGSRLVDISGTLLYAGEDYGFRFGCGPGGIEDGHRVAIDNLTYHTGTVAVEGKTWSEVKGLFR